jgi:phage terminase large subunit
MRPWYNKQEKILYLPNGSWVRFGYAEHHDDIYDFFGKAYDDIAIDEATDLEEDQIVFLKTCNRRTIDSPLTPKFLLTMNPGRIGHVFIKRIFIDKAYIENEIPTDYAFLQAYGWDNVEWCRKALVAEGKTAKEYYTWSDDKRFEYFITKSKYGQDLNALPESDRKAHLLGDWDVFAGQFFSMWRRELHVIAPVTPAGGWKVASALDYGQRTVLEVAFRDYDGRIVYFGECYTEHQDPTSRALAIVELLEKKKLYRLPMVYDTNMDINLKEYTGFDKTPAQIFQDVFKQQMGENRPRMTVVSKKSTDNRGYRAVCNEAFKEYLSWKRKADGSLERRPMLYVTTECPRLIATLPSLIHDKDSHEGLDFDEKVGVDDPYDAAKMLLLELQTPAAPRGQSTWAEALQKRAKSTSGWKPGEG